MSQIRVVRGLYGSKSRTTFDPKWTILWQKCGRIGGECGKIKAAGDREQGTGTTQKAKKGHFTPKLYDLYVFQNLNF